MHCAEMAVFPGGGQLNIRLRLHGDDSLQALYEQLLNEKGLEGLWSQSSLLQKMQVFSILSGAVAFQKTRVSLILSGVVAEGLATSQLAPLAQLPPILTSNL
jgi:hypothetical protein